MAVSFITAAEYSKNKLYSERVHSPDRDEMKTESPIGNLGNTSAFAFEAEICRQSPSWGPEAYSFGSISEKDRSSLRIVQ